MSLFIIKVEPAKNDMQVEMYLRSNLNSISRKKSENKLDIDKVCTVYGHLLQHI